MSISIVPAMVPSRRERAAIVYVMARHQQGRPINVEPLHNAGERDLFTIWNEDRLVNYPVVRDNFTYRRNAEIDINRKNLAWAKEALDAIDNGRPIPGRQRLRFEQVLLTLHAAGPHGANRKEICRKYDIDGGRVSGAMTALHAAGVIFSLVGVYR